MHEVRLAPFFLLFPPPFRRPLYTDAALAPHCLFIIS